MIPTVLVLTKVKQQVQKLVVIEVCVEVKEDVLVLLQKKIDSLLLEEAERQQL